MPCTRLIAALCLLAITLALPGCDDTDAASVRIVLKPDFSGEVRTTTLVIPADARPPAGATSGITWDARADLASSAGAFANLADVHIEDMAFVCGRTPDGLAYVKVTLPRGKAAKWPGALTTLSSDSRANAAKRLAPDAKDSTIGAKIKVQIDLPARPASHGLVSLVHGVDESADRTRAVLLVPVDVATAEGEPLVWHLTWEVEK